WYWRKPVSGHQRPSPPSALPLTIGPLSPGTGSQSQPLIERLAAERGFPFALSQIGDPPSSKSMRSTTTELPAPVVPETRTRGRTRRLGESHMHIASALHSWG